MIKIRHGKISTVLVHIIIIMFAFFIQTSIFPLIPFFNASPNLLLIITFSYGLLYGESIGLITGFFCGLLCDMYFSGVFGSFMLIYSLIGFGNGMLNTSFFEDSITTPMLLSLANGFIYNFYIYFVHFLIRQKFNLPYYFVNVMIPNVLFTLIVTVIVYKFIYRFHFIWKR
ncbi:MAG: rod shape-determining protein MreD [Lachnospiraceae bacterium]|nr:rod shape-determining protein MreD [Lachnospiraceae bacterium]